MILPEPFREGDIDWQRALSHLDDHGWAMVEKLLTADECATIARLYDDDGRFRSQVLPQPVPDSLADRRAGRTVDLHGSVGVSVGHYGFRFVLSSMG